MSARHKLNGIYFGLSVVTGGIIGALAESWIVFVVVALVSIGCLTISGDIRPNGRKR